MSGSSKETTSVFICHNCKTYGRPRNTVCKDCRIMYLEKQNEELIEQQPYVIDDIESKEVGECSECVSKIERINKLSELLHQSEKDKEDMLAQYKEEFDKLMNLNKQILSAHEDHLNGETEIQKKLSEKEHQLKKLEDEEVSAKKRERLDQLSKPKLARSTNAKSPVAKHQEA